MLTLASSAFALPCGRMAVGVQGWSSSAPSARGGDSLSHFENIAQDGDADGDRGSVLEDEDQMEERDIDASVRALRPRSSRRGSWDSETSGWSARIGLGGIGTPPLARERSILTINSVPTSVDRDPESDGVETHDQVKQDNGADLSLERALKISPAMTPSEESQHVSVPVTSLGLQDDDAPHPECLTDLLEQVASVNGDAHASTEGHEPLHERASEEKEMMSTSTVGEAEEPDTRRLTATAREPSDLASASTPC